MRHRPATAALVLAALAALIAPPAPAADLVVNRLDDVAGGCPAACTLRAALAGAQAGDRIVFAPTLPLPGSITLAAGVLTIDRDVEIIGPGADRWQDA